MPVQTFGAHHPARWAPESPQLLLYRNKFAFCNIATVRQINAVFALHRGPGNRFEFTARSRTLHAGAHAPLPPTPGCCLKPLLQLVQHLGYVRPTVQMIVINLRLEFKHGSQC